MMALWSPSRNASYAFSGRLAIAALLAVALGTAAVGLTVLSDHAELRAVGHPSSPAMELLIGLSFAAAGLVAWYRRGGKRFGPFFCAVGGGWVFGAPLPAHPPRW